MPGPISLIGNILRLVLFAFLVLMVLIHPLFNLILASKSTTRHAFSDQARRGVKWYLGPIALSLLLLVL